MPGLPAQVDAERLARDVLARAGFDLTGATASSTGGTGFWYVSFTAAIGGLPVLGGQWSVTVGANGSVLSASGRLADPVDVGDYPLAGVHRLEEGGKWIVYSGPVPMLGGPVPMLGAPLGGSAAVTTAAVPPMTASAPSSSAGSTPGGGPAVPPASSPCRPGEPCPPVWPTTPVSVAPVVVTITGVHLAAAWAWPLDPSSHVAWLVPVYVFQLTGAAAYPLSGNEVPCSPSPASTSPPRHRPPCRQACPSPAPRQRPIPWSRRRESPGRCGARARGVLDRAVH